MTRTSIFLIGVTLVFLAGCGAEPTYVRGRVLDARSDKPLPKVKVDVMLEYPNRPAEKVADAETNDEGIFAVRFQRMYGATNRYKYRVARDGYHSQSLSVEEMNAQGGGLLVGTMDKKIMKEVRLSPK